MPYVFQTKDKSGKPHKNWRFQYRDYQGVKRTGTGTSSKRDTAVMAETIEAEHTLIRNGHKEPPKKKNKYIQRKFMDVVEEYLCWGRTQGGRGGKPWSDIHAKMRESHLKKWKENLKSEKLGVLEFCLPKVEKVIQTLSAEKKSGKTISNFVESLRSFCNFCIRRTYLDEDPLKFLGKIDSTPKKVRRCLSKEEINSLLNTVEEEHFLILYKTALATGLRANELRQLSTNDLHKSKMALILSEKWTKNRKGGLHPIPECLYIELQDFIGKAKLLYDKYQRDGKTIKVPDSPLLYVPGQVFRTINRHYCKANIEIETQDGVVDFHALRVTYINLIVESGANSKTAQALARHSSVDMTFNRYGRTKEELLLTSVEHLSSTILAQRENKKAVKPEGSTTYKVEHKGLEPLTSSLPATRSSQTELMPRRSSSIF